MTWIDEEIDLEKVNLMATGMLALLGIRFTEVTEDGLVASMPVTEHTHQPFGILHGGATATLAESVGSYASYLKVRKQGKHAVGMEVTAQHLRSLKSGNIHARAHAVHLGSKVHVWDIRVTDDDNRLIALCKLSVMILDLK